MTYTVTIEITQTWGFLGNRTPPPPCVCPCWMHARLEPTPSPLAGILGLLEILYACTITHARLWRTVALGCAAARSGGCGVGWWVTKVHRHVSCQASTGGKRGSASLNQAFEHLLLGVRGNMPSQPWSVDTGLIVHATSLPEAHCQVTSTWIHMSTSHVWRQQRRRVEFLATV